MRDGAIYISIVAGASMLLGGWFMALGNVMADNPLEVKREFGRGYRRAGRGVFLVGAVLLLPAIILLLLSLVESSGG